MAKNKYQIANGNAKPPPLPETGLEDEELSESVMGLLLSLRGIADERIEKRVRDIGDIARVFTAEVTAVNSTTNVVLGSVNVDNASINVARSVPTSVTVRYNDDDYVKIDNKSVQILGTNKGQWCKICTYDGVEFFVLHVI